jgi:hypothetical protein
LRAIISIVRTQCIAALRSGSRVFAVIVLLAQATSAETASSPDSALLAGLTSDFALLDPPTIRPAQGYIRYSYLIPAGDASSLQ